MADDLSVRLYDALTENPPTDAYDAVRILAPIIEEGVRAASEKAWDEATRNALNYAYLNHKDGITLYLRPPHDANPYRATETGAEHDD